MKSYMFFSGIRQLQLVLLKVSLLLGVEVHTGVEFQGLMEPSGEDGTHICQTAVTLSAIYFSVNHHQYVKQQSYCERLMGSSQVGWPSYSPGLILPHPSSLTYSSLLEEAGLSLTVRQSTHLIWEVW